MMKLIMLLSMIFNMTFMQMNHPLSMGLLLLLQTNLICLMTGLMTYTFWFSYILFLIFVGGMLVLFIYVTTLASNEMFYLSMKKTSVIILMMMMLLIIMMLMDNQMFSLNIQNNEMQKISMLTTFMPENKLNLNKLYNYPTNMITLMMINYLLITLVAAAKITNVFYGPLRQFN